MVRQKGFEVTALRHASRESSSSSSSSFPAWIAGMKLLNTNLLLLDLGFDNFIIVLTCLYHFMLTILAIDVSWGRWVSYARLTRATQHEWIRLRQQAVEGETKSTTPEASQKLLSLMIGIQSGYIRLRQQAINVERSPSCCLSQSTFNDDSFNNSSPNGVLTSVWNLLDSPKYIYLYKILSTLPVLRAAQHHSPCLRW